MPITIARTTSASRPTDTRKTPDILSIVVTAYPLPEQRETSPGVVTVGRAIYPKVLGSPQFASNQNGSVATSVYTWRLRERTFPSGSLNHAT